MQSKCARYERKDPYGGSTLYPLKTCPLLLLAATVRLVREGLHVYYKPVVMQRSDRRTTHMGDASPDHRRGEMVIISATRLRRTRRWVSYLEHRGTMYLNPLAAPSDSTCASRDIGNRNCRDNAPSLPEARGAI